MLKRAATLVALASLWAAPARAQDEQDADAPVQRSAEEPAHTPPAHTPRSSTHSTSRWRLEYEGSVAAMQHLESSDTGLLTDGTLGVTWLLGSHTLSLSLQGEQDPFAIKSSNFSEDESDQSATRLTQWSRELTSSVGYKHEAEAADTSLTFDLARRWCETQSDGRWVASLDADVEWGARGRDEGLFVSPAGSVFRRLYPDYFVADRAIDQLGGELSIETGYRWGRRLQASLQVAERLTSYDNARYDAVDDTGTVVRATQSKQYLRHSVGASLTARPTEGWRVRLAYELSRNDSQHYDREMTGRLENGNLERRLIRDYEDSLRHQTSLRLTWAPRPTVEASAEGSWWRRAFDTYQARDATNHWIDETRVDSHLDAEVSVRWTPLRSAAADLSLLLAADVTSQVSNMERELSFATNYDVTRVWFGLAFAR